MDSSPRSKSNINNGISETKRDSLAGRPETDRSEDVQLKTPAGRIISTGRYSHIIRTGTSAGTVSYVVGGPGGGGVGRCV